MYRNLGPGVAANCERPLFMQEIWSIRMRLQSMGSKQDLAPCAGGGHGTNTKTG